jgi:hypothetical protein
MPQMRYLILVRVVPESCRRLSRSPTIWETSEKASSCRVSELTSLLVVPQADDDGHSPSAGGSFAIWLRACVFNLVCVLLEAGLPGKFPSHVW